MDEDSIIYEDTFGGEITIVHEDYESQQLWFESIKKLAAIVHESSLKSCNKTEDGMIDPNEAILIIKKFIGSTFTEISLSDNLCISDFPRIFAAIKTSTLLIIDSSDKSIIQCMGIDDSPLEKRIIVSIYRNQNAYSQLNIRVVLPAYLSLE